MSKTTAQYRELLDACLETLEAKLMAFVDVPEHSYDREGEARRHVHIAVDSFMDNLRAAKLDDGGKTNG